MMKAAWMRLPSTLRTGIQGVLEAVRAHQAPGKICLSSLAT
jgi:hypothetical protein